MKDNYSQINFHSFIDEILATKDFKIVQITEKLMRERLYDFMVFVNGIRSEYGELYGWEKENEEYFLNGLKDKWEYSFSIMDRNDNIFFVNFSSVYGDIIHNHCTYAHKNTRNLSFAKLHMVKLCQKGLDNGFKYQEGYWPKNNNRSIILFLRMGWEIQEVRKNNLLFMKADLEKVRNQTFELVKGRGS